MLPYIYENFLPHYYAIGLYFCIATALFVIFIFGQFSWSLYITSIYIGKLTKRFDITIQPGHSDRCGGLKPLGDFCFDGAKILIAVGLVLAVMAITDLDQDEVLSFFASVVLVVFIAPLTALTVFLPLWNIHGKMVSSKRAYQDKFTAQAMELEEEIYINTGIDGAFEKAKSAREKLEIFQVLHPDSRPFPVWPFHLPSTILKIVSPQLLLGVAEFLININSIIDEIQKLFMRMGF